MPSHRIVLISLMISAYAGNVESLFNLFHYGSQNPNDPYYLGLVKTALLKQGISFHGCTLTNVENKRWLLGSSYKVKYVCKVDVGKKVCTLHFRQKKLHFGKLSSDFPLCKVIPDPTKYVTETTTTSEETTEETTTEETTTEETTTEETTTEETTTEETTTEETTTEETTTEETTTEKTTTEETTTEETTTEETTTDCDCPPHDEIHDSHDETHDKHDEIHDSHDETHDKHHHSRYEKQKKQVHHEHLKSHKKTKKHK